MSSAGASVVTWSAVAVQAHLRRQIAIAALWVGRDAFVVIDGDELRDRCGYIPRSYPLCTPPQVLRRIRAWQRSHPVA
jgi:hypothetical protein